jgi:fructose-specific PTS system IIA-like component
LKAELLRLKRADCRGVLNRAIECATVSEVTSLLDEFTAQHAAPLLSPELIVVDVDATTKEEAIKRGVDLLYIHGRTEHPRTIERAVWQREASYSTGFGYGFAIPHCKTNAVQANSLVLLKLRKPIQWGSLDESPVKVVVLLVVREGDGASQHLKVISTLARQVMHEDFRARLEQESQPAAICRFLSNKMGG